jgi:membrane fusion protein (multidrug efflux system)
MTATPAGDVGASPPSSARRSASRVLRLAFAALMLGGGAYAGGSFVAARLGQIHIDDARIGADLITVSSEVNGRVARVAILPGDAVAQGAAMVEIDREQAELELRVLEAQIAGLRSQRAQIGAQQAMIRAQVASRLEAAAAQANAAEAAHRSARASLEKARSSFARISALLDRAVMSRQIYEDAQAALLVAQQQELATAAGIELARANRAAIQAEEAQIAVLDHQIATLAAQSAALAAQLDQKRIELAKRDIRAGFAGVIDAVFVDPGEYVSPGTRLLIYHDPGRIWVDANVKDTDFRRLRLGARATIKVDAYPALALEGRIVRLGHAATSQFALLPSPNPSGNFTKVTQRLPLRIAIEQKDGMLRPGMMVDVGIDVVD